MTLPAEVAEVLDGRRLWCVVGGDCLDVLPAIPGRSIDSTIQDPPYEAEAHTLQRRIKSADAPGSTDGDKGRGVRFEPVTFEPMTDPLRRATGLEVARLTKRWMLTFCQVEASHKWAAAIVDGGGRYRRTNVWIKPDGQPQLNGLEPAQGYESICLCHSPSAMHWNGGGRMGVYSHCTAKADGERVHDTPKPIPLMVELVELFTDPDEVVLDPFAGSGTTGVACLRTGRRFIGIEKDERCAAIARERLEAESQGLTLRAARAGQLPMFPVGP